MADGTNIIFPSSMEISISQSRDSFVKECAMKLFVNSAFIDPVSGQNKDEVTEAKNALRRAELLASMLF